MIIKITVPKGMGDSVLVQIREWVTEFFSDGIEENGKVEHVKVEVED